MVFVSLTFLVGAILGGGIFAGNMGIRSGERELSGVLMGFEGMGGEDSERKRERV